MNRRSVGRFLARLARSTEATCRFTAETNHLQHKDSRRAAAIVAAAAALAALAIPSAAV